MKTKNMTISEKLEYLKDTERRKEIPLLKASYYTQFKNKSYKEMFHNYWDNILEAKNEMLNDSQLSQPERDRRAMSDYFSYISNPENRQNALNDSKIGDFEYNLEIVTDAFVLSKLRIEELGKNLPAINAIKSQLMWLNLKFDKAYPHLTEWFESYVNGLYYGKSNVKKEDESKAKIAEVVTSWTSMLNLGLSPLQGVVQLLQGMWATASFTFGNYANDERFRFEDLSKSTASCIIN
jgi:hypothetical protein